MYQLNSSNDGYCILTIARPAIASNVSLKFNGICDSRAVQVLVIASMLKDGHCFKSTVKVPAGIPDDEEGHLYLVLRDSPRADNARCPGTGALGLVRPIGLTKYEKLQGPRISEVVFRRVRERSSISSISAALAYRSTGLCYLGSDI